MSIVLFILALAAAFIGTIFAFRAVHRIHNGESYTIPMSPLPAPSA